MKTTSVSLNKTYLCPTFDLHHPTFPSIFFLRIIILLWVHVKVYIVEKYHATPKLINFIFVSLSQEQRRATMNAGSTINREIRLGTVERTPMVHFASVVKSKSLNFLYSQGKLLP